MSLRLLLLRAFDLKPYELRSSGSLDEPLYEVEAMMPESASKGVWRQMLQRLLIERFQLEMEWTRSDMRVYFLRVGKKGHKLKPLADPSRSGYLTFGTDGVVKTTSVTTLAFILAGCTERPVIDATNLHGDFDIELNAEPRGLKFFDDLEASSGNRPEMGDQSGRSLFAAVNDLGLVLEPGRSVIRQLTVLKRERVPVQN